MREKSREIKPTPVSYMEVLSKVVDRRLMDRVWTVLVGDGVATSSLTVSFSFKEFTTDVAEGDVCGE
jgi:hypothetical protein